MGAELRFSFAGEEQVTRNLLGVAERAEDVRPAWDVIEERFAGYEEDWFASQGHGTWPPLSKSYAEWKAKHFPGASILVRSGHLRDTATRPDIAVKEPVFAVFGTGDPVAGRHQTGGGRLPRRAVIDVDDDEIDEWAQIIERFIVDGEDG